MAFPARANTIATGKPDDKLGTELVEDVNDGSKSNVASTDDPGAIEHTQTGKFSWLVSVTAAIGGMLFGYCTSIISAVLLYIGQDLGNERSSAVEELITSITSGGAFFGAIFTGLSADKYGRKAAIYAGCSHFIVGAILQAAAFSLVQMTVGRLVVGAGVGSAATIVPMYIAEVSPAKYRGRIVSLDNMCITSSQLVSYGIRKSPRQLVYHHKVDNAKAVLRRIFPNATEDMVDKKSQHILYHVEKAKSYTRGMSQWWVVKQLYVVPANLRVLLAACGLMGISQLEGFNSLMYYSSLLFSLVGFSNIASVGTVIAGTNFIFTLVNLLLVGRLGRRRILLFTAPPMGVALVIAAVAFKWTPIDLNDLSLESGANVGWPAVLVSVSMVVYVALYSTGMGNTAWLSSEFFPMEVRATGTMMLTCTCWGCNVIVSSTLTQMENTTPSGVFGFYAAICLLGSVAISLCYPEVSGLTLEDIRATFQDGFGINNAQKLRKRLEAERKARAGLV